MNPGDVELFKSGDNVSPDDYMDDAEYEEYLKSKESKTDTDVKNDTVENKDKADKDRADKDRTDKDRTDKDSNIALQDWLLTILLINIPFIGLVPCIYMIFSRGSNNIKKRFCKAWLIYQLILFAITFIFMYIGVHVVANVVNDFLVSIGH